MCLWLLPLHLIHSKCDSVRGCPTSTIACPPLGLWRIATHPGLPACILTPTAIVKWCYDNTLPTIILQGILSSSSKTPRRSPNIFVFCPLQNARLEYLLSNIPGRQTCLFRPRWTRVCSTHNLANVSLNVTSILFYLSTYRTSTLSEAFDPLLCEG